jgi:hypothetical protein
MPHLVLSTEIAIAIVLPTITAQSSGSKALQEESHPSRSVAACQSFPVDTSGEMVVVSSFAPEPAYIDLHILGSD